MAKVVNLTKVRESKKPTPKSLVEDFLSGKFLHISITTMDADGSVNQHKFTYDSLSAKQPVVSV